MVETRLLFINSADRTSNSASSSDFEIEFFHRELRFSRFRVRKVVIPKTIYNVDSSNNVVYFNDGSAKTATLTNGSYSTIDQLATEITSKVTTASGIQTYTYTYDSVTGFLTITSSGTSSFTWSSNLNLGKMCGYVADTASGTSHVSTQRVNLENRPWLYLTCKQLADQSISSNQGIDNSILSVNSISHAYGGVIEEVYDLYPHHTLGAYQTFNRLSFRLVDASGNVVDLNGSEFFVELDVE